MIGKFGCDFHVQQPKIYKEYKQSSRSKTVVVQWYFVGQVPSLKLTQIKIVK